MATYAIICEGISENLSLHAIIEKLSQEDTYFADIQPRTDVNHSHAVQQGSGGWTEVLSHCNTGVFKQALQSNDYLIVQVDTDRCDDPLFGIKKTDDNNQPRPDADIYIDIIERLLQGIAFPCSTLQHILVIQPTFQATSYNESDKDKDIRNNALTR